MRICYVVASTENKVFRRDECTQFVHFILFLLQMLHLYTKGKKSHFFPNNHWMATTEIYSLNLISISFVRPYWHLKWNRSVWKNIYFLLNCKQLKWSTSQTLISLPDGFVWFGVRVKFLWGEFNLTMITVTSRKLICWTLAMMFGEDILHVSDFFSNVHRVSFMDLELNWNSFHKKN